MYRASLISSKFQTQGWNGGEPVWKVSLLIWENTFELWTCSIFQALRQQDNRLHLKDGPLELVLTTNSNRIPTWNLRPCTANIQVTFKRKVPVAKHLLNGGWRLLIGNWAIHYIRRRLKKTAIKITLPGSDFSQKGGRKLEVILHIIPDVTLANYIYSGIMTRTTLFHLL